MFASLDLGPLGAEGPPAGLGERLSKARSDDPILEIHNVSLTSYLATEATKTQDIWPRVQPG